MRTAEKFRNAMKKIDKKAVAEIKAKQKIDLDLAGEGRGGAGSY